MRISVVDLLVVENVEDWLVGLVVVENVEGWLDVDEKEINVGISEVIVGYVVDFSVEAVENIVDVCHNVSNPIRKCILFR